MLDTKSLDHKAAAVIIPPEDAWGPIQAIRRKHDRKVGRRMPHITLIYPFHAMAYSQPRGWHHCATRIGHSMAVFGGASVSPPTLG